MNPTERLLARLRGEVVDRPPNFNIMMQFASHAIDQPLSRYYQDYRVLCDANFAVQEMFKLDILQAISDPYREAADAGLAVDFPYDGLPIARTPLLQEPTDLAKLRYPEPENGRRMSDRLSAVRRFREQAGGQIPILGWVEGALAEAADVRGVSALMTDLYDRPGWVRELLEVCAEAAVAFARAQVAAGADIIGLGDAIASQVSPRVYRELALPHEQRIFAAVHEMGALARLHICGNTSRILNDMVLSGADIIDVDWMVDAGKAASAFGERAVFCGNQDPVAIMLNGTEAQVRDAVMSVLIAAGPRCISMAGCEIPDGTPPENLLAHGEVLAEWGTSTPYSSPGPST